jgi:putative endonuclease
MQDNTYRKQSWYEGEDIAQTLYESHGYSCKDKNFTIRGGEIDLIMENDVNIIFVECKVVNYVENLHDYITPKKLQALRHAIDTYLWKYPTQKNVRVDIVFIKHKEVVEIIKNIEL